MNYKRATLEIYHLEEPVDNEYLMPEPTRDFDYSDYYGHV